MQKLYLIVFLLLVQLPVDLAHVGDRSVLAIYRNTDGFNRFNTVSESAELVYENAGILDHYFSNQSTKVIFQTADAIWAASTDDWNTRIVLPINNHLIRVSWLPTDDHAIITTSLPPNADGNSDWVISYYLYDWGSEHLNNIPGGRCPSIVQDNDSGDIALLCHDADEFDHIGDPQILIDLHGGTQLLETADLNSYDTIVLDLGLILRTAWVDSTEENPLVFASYGERGFLNLFRLTTDGQVLKVGDLEPENPNLVVSPDRKWVGYFSRCAPVSTCFAIADLDDGNVLWESSVSDGFTFSTTDQLWWSPTGDYIAVTGYAGEVRAYSAWLLHWQNYEVIGLSPIQLPDDIIGNIGFVG
jgi:hypothetical protein